MYNKCFGLDLHIARFYNVYGPLEIEDGEFASLIGKWYGNVKRKEKIAIVGTGEQSRDFTHVDDIVDGLIRIMDYNKTDFLEAITQIIIVPGYKFKVINGLITNFHQPQSHPCLVISISIDI